MSYKVKLKTFEGPFDLLVYLIENARMDIYDIKVSEITRQYLDYIEHMKEIEVEMASEFMVLAANLIEIKSRMLLPKITSEGISSDMEDPRSDLVERLIEYKRYKSASELFRQMEDAGTRIHEKPSEDISEFTDEPEEVLTLDIDQFMHAFEMFLNRKKKVREMRMNYDNVRKKKITSEARVEFIRKLFEAYPDKKYSFSSTLQDPKDRYDVALSFTSVLEMVKQKQIEAEQKFMFGDIIISKGSDFDKKTELKEDKGE